MTVRASFRKDYAPLHCPAPTAPGLHAPQQPRPAVEGRVKRALHGGFRGAIVRRRGDSAKEFVAQEDVREQTSLRSIGGVLNDAIAGVRRRPYT